MRCDLCGKDLFDLDGRWSFLDTADANLSICPACTKFILSLPLRYYRRALGALKMSGKDETLFEKLRLKYVGRPAHVFDVAVLPDQKYRVTLVKDFTANDIRRDSVRAIVYIPATRTKPPTSIQIRYLDEIAFWREWRDI